MIVYAKTDKASNDSPSLPSRGWAARELAGIAALIVALALLWNGNFAEWTKPKHIHLMNDVPPILDGFHKTPNLLIDGLSWWHGPWIEQGIQVFRPVSSYLLWIESWVGLHWGFLWVAWFGMLLFMADCLLTTALAWRLTRSKVCTLFAAALVPAIRNWNWAGTQPYYWLAWYPLHHDLLMIGCLMGALLAFDCWLESGERKRLFQSWCCFLIGVLAKEFVYVFPLMAFALAYETTRTDAARRKSAIRQAGLMLLVVGCLSIYRWLVLPSPYNPPLVSPKHLFWNSVLFLFPSYLKSVVAKTYWFIGLAWLVYAIGAILLWLPRGRFKPLIKRPFAWVAVWIGAFAVLGLYCAITYDSPVVVLLYLLEERNNFVRLNELSQMVFAVYSLWLLWKYRHQERSTAAFALFALAYAPVISYLGWHYTMAGWFMRCAAYWPLVGKLVWRDVSGFRGSGISGP